MIERGKSNDKKRMCHWELQSMENEISPKPKQKQIDGIDESKVHINVIQLSKEKKNTNSYDPLFQHYPQAPQCLRGAHEIP